jgi:lipid A 3-O-deacylase
VIARRFAVLLFAMAVPHRTAIAQSVPMPHSLSLRVDNDAFDFWMLPWNRPDDEYTSGVHITYDGGDAPWWSRHFLGGDRGCPPHSQDCRSARAELGQDIYTRDATLSDPRVIGRSRPSAGWLYLAQTARALKDQRSDELTLTLGVTGPPSLAQYTQRIAHSAAPTFNRPTDWSRQIEFEPGVIARYEHRERLVVANGTFGLDVIPRVAASVGNVLTAGEVGVQLRTGWKLVHPWLPQMDATSIALVAGISGQAVARNIFLDGNTFQDGPRVGHLPLVGSGELGLELRYRVLSLAYRAVSDTRAYDAGPRWHPWSSMVGGFTFDR